MAHIDRVTIHRQTIALQRPFVTAVRTAVSVDVLLVEVRDSDGRCGWGEAPTSWRVTGESVESVTAAVSGPLRGAVRGLTSDDPEAASAALERAAVRNSSARMALDCALFDLAAQEQGVPLFRYLGAGVAHVRTDMTLSAAVSESDVDSLVRTAIEFAHAGFSTLKIKAGAGGDDAMTIIEVRRAVGDDVALRVDANQGWSPQQAVNIIATLEDAGVGVELIEQPVLCDDVDGLAFVTGHAQTPIMADESVWTRRDLREIIKSHAADMINIKLAKTGGLREALELASQARRNDVGIIIGCMAETHVGIGAAAALASVIDARDGGNSRPHDLDGGLLLTRSPVEGGVTYDGERVLLSELPGSGIVGLAGG